ncbi:MAG: SDR family oxidoreductase [Bacteroidales bacterium]|nr:SDR family oxidoreductase [Bacteroidales bacterium]
MNIVVTGASRGIGFAVVKRLAQSGNHKIVGLARDGKKLDQLKLECLSLNPDAEIFPVTFDLSTTDFEKGLSQILQSFSSVDILINNAGWLVNKPFIEMTDEDFDNTFNVNVKSVFKISQLLLPYFNKPAHIVNISSMGGVQGSSKFPGLSLYSAAKGAVAVLTEAMAEELKKSEIRVNCLAFGAVQTEMLQAAFPGYTAPLQPDEMARFVADFALTGHQFFNGKILPVSLSTP